jgi:protein TonB
MKRYERQIKFFPIALCCSLGIHGIIIILLRLSLKTEAMELSEALMTKPFSMVNISVLEPETKIEPERPTELKFTEEQADGAAEIAAEESTAEIFVPIEKPVMGNETGLSIVPGDKQGDDNSVLDTPPGNNELAAAYITGSLNYIQPRIRDKLKYPPQARRAGIRGTAEAAFTINADGTVKDLLIRKSSGEDVLDKAALEAVAKAAPFRPPSVPVRIVIPIVFNIK